jgi:hypothetical protein
MGSTPITDRWEAGAKRQLELAAIRLTLELAKALMRETPVDTGHAQRNWHTSVTQPVTTPTDEPGAQQRGQAEVLGYKLDMGPLWVANPVDYVFWLNYGTSKKAAAGWIETTTYQVLQRELQRAKDKFGADSDVAQMVQSVQSGFLDAGNEGAAEGIASAYSPFGDE